MDEFERGIGCLDRRIIKVLLMWVFESPTPMPTPNTQPTTWSRRPVVLSLRVAGWAARLQFSGVSRQKHGKKTDDWIHTIEAPLFRPKASGLVDIDANGASKQGRGHCVERSVCQLRQLLLPNRHLIDHTAVSNESIRWHVAQAMAGGLV